MATLRLGVPKMAHCGSRTLHGVSTIASRAALANGKAPPVVIESVAVDDQTLNLGFEKDIPPGHERLSFEYTGISLASPQRVRFRYRLEGFDRDWVEAGTRRTASLHESCRLENTASS